MRQTTTELEGDVLDRRRVWRRKVCLVGRVRIADGSFIPCVVRDISPMGSNFEVAADVVLPETFQLQIPDDLFSADCILRYRKDEKAGVEFTSSRAEALARYG